jgi:S-adenosylmethionine:tRNA ribosyltransferase-isomerase
LKTSDFDYLLPTGLIAQNPIEARDQSRLMVLNRRDGSIEHLRFYEIIDLLKPGDVLILNDSRVIPARLNGRKVDGGAKVEVLLLHRLGVNLWEALVKPGKRLHVGNRIEISKGPLSAPVMAEVKELKENGVRVLSFSDETRLQELGNVPLPPYIHAPLSRAERYQTVYARIDGSAAAPTAGLHFTPELLQRVRNRGVKTLFVTLHIGLDTFRPVKEDDPSEHVIHKEFAVLSPEVAVELSAAKKEGRRVICVGTTSVRIVEQAAQASSGDQIQPWEGWVSLFILPGYRFKMVDALITNFHLPRSTLLMLVSAFAGKELIDKAYQEAIKEKYRFFSFGDAMFIV